jgi:hypothetical protein
MNPQNSYKFAAFHAFSLSFSMMAYSFLGMESPLHPIVYSEASLQCMADDPTCTLFMRMAMGGVLVISYCYWMISRDLSQTGLIWMGIIAKTCVFLIFLEFYLGGTLSLPMMLVGLSDLIFAGLFF